MSLKERLQKSFWPIILRDTAGAIVLLAGGAVLLSKAFLKLADYTQTPMEMQELSAIFDGRLFFHPEYAPVDWAGHFSDLGSTGLMVLFALIWSTTISLFLGYQLASKGHRRLWDFTSGLFTLVSGFPIFIIGILSWNLLIIIMGFKAGEQSTVLLQLLAGGLILGSCEGALGEWPRSFRTIFSELQDSSAFLAQRARGQSTIGLAYRMVQPYLWYSLPTRVSYLFGASLVLEQALNFKYLGYVLIDSLENYNKSFAYRDAMIAGLFIMAVSLLIRTLFGLVAKHKERRQAALMLPAEQ